MKKESYLDDQYIADIGNLSETPFSHKSIVMFCDICERLHKPMLYWQLRWFHRCFYVVSFALGIFIGLKF